jgi:hypothetical protein
VYFSAKINRTDVSNRPAITVKRFCNNCYHPLPYKAKFCAHCGQKNTDGKVSVGEVMQQLWFRILHLESRSWRVLWRLFIPGQVSLDYFRGKRKRYPPPVQFFFVIMFFFLFTLNHFLGDGSNFRVRMREGGAFQVGSQSGNAELAVDVYQLGRERLLARRFRAAYDSLPPEYQTPQVRMAVDSILKITGSKTEETWRGLFATASDSTAANIRVDSVTFSLPGRRLQVAWEDIFLYTPEELIARYQFTHWIDHALLRQGIKSIKAPQSLVKAYLGSLAWTLLLLVALMAGALTLLYIRRNRYYVEHFIFLLHEHTTMFLLLTLAVLLINLTNLDMYVWAAILIWFLLSPTVAMKRFYRQSWTKTLLKSAIFSILYAFGFLGLFLGSVIVIFFLF